MRRYGWQQRWYLGGGGETANNGLELFTWALACALTVDSGGRFQWLLRAGRGLNCTYSLLVSGLGGRPGAPLRHFAGCCAWRAG